MFLRVLLAVFFAVIIGMACGAPTNEDVDQVLVPQPRITCDIFGSDALCALHCMGHGNRGGYCNSQRVCVCRN